MNIEMKLIFDVIVTLLGIIVIISGFTSMKRGTVTSFFIPEPDLKKTKDKAGLCKRLFPIIEVFGGVCLIFGIESLVNDAFYELPKIIYLFSVLAFLGCWMWFSMMLKKIKDEFVSPF